MKVSANPRVVIFEFYSPLNVEHISLSYIHIVHILTETPQASEPEFLNFCQSM
jgi:hypothetical protein